MRGKVKLSYVDNHHSNVYNESLLCENKTQAIEICVGGDEPPLMIGHWGGGEPIVKPAEKVGFVF